MSSLTFDARTIAALCTAVAVVSFLALIATAVRHYEHAFARSVGAGLKYSFVIASTSRLFVASIAATVVFGLVGYFSTGPVGAIAGMISGVVAPRFGIAMLRKRRTLRFIYQLPDALLALASALRAGANLTKGLELLSSRQPPPLSQEFTIVLAEYRVGRALADSLSDLRKRVDSPELDLLNTAINVSRRVGGNLADTLEALAKTLQEKSHIEAKIEALTAMGRAQGWVVALLPLFVGLVLYQQQPERMSLLFTAWYGWAVLGIVAVMMTIAVWMIRKIVHIDV
jgi:tight adherence protein B